MNRAPESLQPAGLGTASVLARALALGLTLAALGCGSPEHTLEWVDDPAQPAAAKTLRVLNRDITAIEDRNGVRLSAASGNGVAWVEGTDFRSGTIEVNIRGREDLGQNFVGVAFHSQNDNTYEAVYVRPFNFRAEDPVRKQHAVQYIKLPEFDWEPLRNQFPEEFENPVAAWIEPTDWVSLRVVVEASRVEIYVGPVQQVTLEVRKLGQLESGQVGLWVGNGSGGDFANLVVTPGGFTAASAFREPSHATPSATSPSRVSAHGPVSGAEVRRLRGRPPEAE